MAELTKHGTQTNIRIPPESTGSRVRYAYSYALRVSGITFPDIALPWEISTPAGAVGFVVAAGNIQNVTDKRLDVILRDDSTSINFAEGETFTINGDGVSQTGTVVSFERIYTQAVAISGGNNPNNLTSVDSAGSLFVRFTEGAQQLDPKGLTRISTPVTVLDVKFIESVNDTSCFGKLTGGGTQTYDANERLLLMDVGTSAGDAVVKRSNRAAFFQGGFASLFETPLAIGDTGKAGVVRRWGYFDNDDGLFFELDGTTLYTVVRSSVSGSVSETRIAQSMWNVDDLGGGGGSGNLSSFNLDVSKMNYYFIDFPGSTAGKVRFGVYGTDGRIVCQEFFFGNLTSFNYMKKAMLPVTWEMFNSTGTASPSRMKTIGGTVMNEGFDTPDSRISVSTSATYVLPNAVTTTGAATTCLMTTRSGKTLPNGQVNKKVSIPQKLVYYVSGGPVLLQIRAGLVPDGASFFKASPFTSPAEIDVTGTFPASPLAQGMPIMSRIYAPGAHVIDPPEAFNVRGQALSLRSDGEYGLSYTFTIKAINPADTVSVLVALDWLDV